MATNLGRIGFVPKGNWSAGTYKFLDVVRYQGSAYACMVATTVNNPSNATDWMLLNSDGASGQVFSYVGDWLNKPTSLTNNYTDRIFITDVGVGGSEWYWDGSRYRPSGKELILTGTDGITATVGNYTLCGTLTLKAGVFQTGDIMEISFVVGKNGANVSNGCGYYLALETWNSYLSTTIPTFGGLVINGSITAAATTHAALYRIKKISATSVKNISNWHSNAAGIFQNSSGGNAANNYTTVTTPDSTTTDTYLNMIGFTASASSALLVNHSFQVKIITA